jgi:hypothetical protein
MLVFDAQKNTHKPTLVDSIGRRPSSLQRNNTRHAQSSSSSSSMCSVVEHLHVHLVLTFVVEGEHATGLEVVGAHELLPAGMELHLAAPVEEHIHYPSAKAVASLQQLQRGRLSLPTTNSPNLSGSLWMPSG